MRKIDLTGVVDKMENKNTTSLKFKYDLIQYFQYIEGSEDFVCIEVGAAHGYSTYVLGQLFKTVYSIEFNKNNLADAQTFNQKHSNINWRNIDAYTEPWEIFEYANVSFIDCIHDYRHTTQDINRSIGYGKDIMYLVFDDYGLFPEVKRAVDDFVASADCQVTYIGHPAGTLVAVDRVVKASEGVILKVKL